MHQTIDYRRLQPGDLPIVDPKRQICTYVSSKRSVNGVHICFGTFVEAFFSDFGVWDAESQRLSVWGTGDEEWDFTSYNTAAKYVARVALNPTTSGFLRCQYCRSRACAQPHVDSNTVRDETASIREIMYYLREKGLGVQLNKLGAMADLAKVLDNLRGRPNRHAMPLSVSAAPYREAVC